MKLLTWGGTRINFPLASFGQLFETEQTFVVFRVPDTTGMEENISECWRRCCRLVCLRRKWLSWPVLAWPCRLSRIHSWLLQKLLVTYGSRVLWKPTPVLIPLLLAADITYREKRSTLWVEKMTVVQLLSAQLTILGIIHFQRIVWWDKTRSLRYLQATCIGDVGTHWDRTKQKTHRKEPASSLLHEISNLQKQYPTQRLQRSINDW